MEEQKKTAQLQDEKDAAQARVEQLTEEQQRSLQEYDALEEEHAKEKEEQVRISVQRTDDMFAIEKEAAEEMAMIYQRKWGRMVEAERRSRKAQNELMGTEMPLDDASIMRSLGLGVRLPVTGPDDVHPTPMLVGPPRQVEGEPPGQLPPQGTDQQQTGMDE